MRQNGALIISADEKSLFRSGTNYYDAGMEMEVGKGASKKQEAGQFTGAAITASETALYLREKVARRPLTEQDYNRIIEALPDIVFELSADGVFTRCYSEQHEDLLLPPEKFVGKKCEEVLPPAIARMTRIKLARALDMMQVERYEYRLIINSQMKFFEARLAPMGENSVLALIRNITERKTAEHELKEYRNYLDKVFSDLPAVLIFKSVPDFKYLMVNSQVEEFIGLSAEEIAGKTDYELLPEYADAIRREDIMAVEAKGALVNFEISMVNINGETRYLYTNKQLFDAGKEKVLLIMSIDVTPQKQAELALARNEIKYRSLIEEAEDRIALLDMTGNIILANKAFYRVLGYNPEEFDARQCLKSVFPEIEDPVSHFLDIVKKRGSYHAEYRTRHRDGHPMDMLAKSVLIRDENKQPTSILMIIRDITELKKIQLELQVAKERAENSDRLKSAFLANMSHEIRTPMNAIVGFASLLTSQQLSEAERRNYVSIINKSSNQLLNLVSDIIDISKIESGQLDIITQHISVNNILKNIYEVFSRQISSEINLKKTVLPEYNDITVLADEVRITQIFNNLLNNALKFTREGEIEFGIAGITQDTATFFVRDTGIGIDDEHKTVIFERFRQGGDAYTRRFGGTGLGLAICRELVSLMGGTIWVESEQGAGAAFYFTLPLIEVVKKEVMTATRYTTPEYEKFSWPDRKILLVDDTKICLKYLQALLKDSGMKLFFAESGQEAVKLFRENPDIDIVLMDIQMPDMSGTEATAIIKKINGRVPVIAQTAHAFVTDKEKFIEAGCDDYIAKPINGTQLLEMLASFLSK